MQIQNNESGWLPYFSMLIKYSIASCLVCSMTSDYRIPFFLLYLRLHSMWYVLYLMRILQMIQIHMMPHWSYDKSSFLNTTWPCIHLTLPLLLPPLLQIRCSVRTFIVKGKKLRLSPPTLNPPKPPRALNHCMDDLLQQKLWCGVYNLPPSTPFPPHRQAHTHFPFSFCF